jgi:Tfp pilus assembly protein PilO
MTRNRAVVWGSALVSVVIFAVGWMVGIQPQLNRISNANQQREFVVAQNAKDEVLLAKLKADYLNIDVMRSDLLRLRTSVPTQAEISSFVTELNSLANIHEVTVKSITVNDAKPYTPNTGGTSPESTGAVTDPRITSNNFIVVPVQFSVAGNYSKVLQFVRSVQTGQRLFLISNFGSTGSTKSEAQGKVDSTVGGYMYVLLGA